MKTYAPEYYKDFKCVADKCKHSCCIGWEIDIDEDTYNYYLQTEGEFSRRLKESISSDGEMPHFILAEEERCPFLNSKGLCDIIITLGEDKLCNICADHPRYRNYFDDRVEIGVGLCCEAAAELILGRKEKVSIVEIADDGLSVDCEEEFFFSMRNRIFDILQNREKPLDERICEMLSCMDIVLPDMTASDWVDVFLKLEYMENDMKDTLFKIKETESEFAPFSAEFETAFEQLLIYFIYRYLPHGLYEGNIKERVAFAVLNLMMLGELCKVRYRKTGSFDFNDLVETVRMYSAEIEYSEENVNTLINVLQK